MGGANRDGTLNHRQSPAALHLNVRAQAEPARRNANTLTTGGKAKPLKAPKKAAKDYDSDDQAYLDKKRAGA